MARKRIKELNHSNPFHVDAGNGDPAGHGPHDSRYNLRSNIPEHLSKVLTELEDEARDRGYFFKNRVDIRAIVKRVAKIESVADADDYVRFLQKTAIVLHDKIAHDWIIDVDRMPHIRHCASKKRDANPAQSAASRISVMRNRGEKARQRVPEKAPDNVYPLPQRSSNPTPSTETAMQTAKQTPPPADRVRPAARSVGAHPDRSGGGRQHAAALPALPHPHRGGGMGGSVPSRR